MCIKYVTVVYHFLNDGFKGFTHQFVPKAFEFRCTCITALLSSVSDLHVLEETLKCT